MNTQFSKEASVYPFCKEPYVNSNTETIAKTFILFNKNITYTGSRDPCNPNLFILNEQSIYQSGAREFRTLKLSENQINHLLRRASQEESKIPQLAGAFGHLRSP